MCRCHLYMESTIINVLIHFAGNAGSEDTDFGQGRVHKKCYMSRGCSCTEQC